MKLILLPILLVINTIAFCQCDAKIKYDAFDKKYTGTKYFELTTKSKDLSLGLFSAVRFKIDLSGSNIYWEIFHFGPLSLTPSGTIDKSKLQSATINKVNEYCSIKILFEDETVSELKAPNGKGYFNRTKDYDLLIKVSNKSIKAIRIETGFTEIYSKEFFDFNLTEQEKSELMETLSCFQKNMN